jgi:hypothetical protein
MAGPKKSLCFDATCGGPTDALRDRLELLPRGSNSPLRFVAQNIGPADTARPETIIAAEKRRTTGTNCWITRPETSPTLSVTEDSGPGGRMKTGTIWSIRDLAVRQGSLAPCTRDSRQRSLPTKHGHAVLCSSFRVIREYQSDSSSKRPASSFLLGFRLLKLESKKE